MLVRWCFSDNMIYDYQLWSIGDEILLRRYYDVVMIVANIWWWHYYDFYSDAHVGDEILLTWWCSEKRIIVLTTSWCSDCDWCSNDRWRNATTIMFKWWHDYCCKDLDVLYYTYYGCMLYLSVLLLRSRSVMRWYWHDDVMIKITALSTWWWRDCDCWLLL